MSLPLRIKVLIAVTATLAGCSRRPSRSTATSASDGSAALLIPAGKFIAGCNASEPSCPAFARPRRHESLQAFFIDPYEVTENDYAACVAEGACASQQPRGASLFPVHVESIQTARAFCKWKGRRLPSTLEWEKAARGTDGRMFPWGNESPTCEHAAYCGTADHDMIFRGITEVGRHPSGRSPYGLHDMAGNAPEWTECVEATASCGVIRSPDHAGVDGLRTYDGHVVTGDMFPPGAGFRCAQ